MYCTIQLFFQTIKELNAEQLIQLIRDLNHVCKTDYRMMYMSMDSAMAEKELFSITKPFEQINSEDIKRINSVVTQNVDKELMPDVYMFISDDDDNICEMIRFCFYYGISCKASVLVSFKISNADIEIMTGHRKLISLFYAYGWITDNSFVCFFKNEKTMWALQGIRYNLFISKNDRSAIKSESRHRARDYTGCIRDVYYGNSLLKEYLSDSVIKRLKEICNGAYDEIEGSLVFDCVQSDKGRLRIDRRKKIMIKELLENNHIKTSGESEGHFVCL